MLNVFLFFSADTVTIGFEVKCVFECLECKVVWLVGQLNFFLFFRSKARPSLVSFRLVISFHFFLFLFRWIKLLLTLSRPMAFNGVFSFPCRPKGYICTWIKGVMGIDAHRLKIQEVLGLLSEGGFFSLGFLKREGSYSFEFYCILICKFF